MGERTCGSVLVRVEAEETEQLVRGGARFARPGADAERRDLDVLPHGERAECVAVLKRPGEAVPAPPVGAPAGDCPPVQLDRPCRREIEAAEQVDERGLAGAVRADQSHDLVAMQFEGDVLECVHPVERAGHVGGPECSSGPPTVVRVSLELRQSD